MIVVNEYNPTTRLALVTDENKTFEVYLPESVAQVVAPGSTVLLDPDNHYILSIISEKYTDKTIIGGDEGDSVLSLLTQILQLKFQGQFLKLTHSGLSVMAKSIDLITENLHLKIQEDGSMHFNSVLLKGKITQTETDITFLTMFHLHVTEDKFSFKVKDAVSKKTIKSYSYNKQKQLLESSSGATLKVKIPDVILEVGSLIGVLKSIQLKVNKINISAKDNDEHYTTSTEFVEDKKTIDAGSVKVRAGGLAGSVIQLLSGAFSGIFVKPSSVDIRAPFIHLGGITEVVPNGYVLSLILIQLIASINVLATAVPLGPLGAAQAASAAALASAQLPIIATALPNNFVRMGIIPEPFLGKI